MSSARWAGLPGRSPPRHRWNHRDHSRPCRPHPVREHAGRRRRSQQGVLREVRVQLQPAVHRRDRACMLVGEQALVMLLSRARFAEFAQLPIADPTTHTLALYCFSVTARDEVDAVRTAALAAGGSEADGPEDLGFMYSRSFYDLDGHGWQVMWMDPAARARSRGACGRRLESRKACECGPFVQCPRRDYVRPTRGLAASAQPYARLGPNHLVSGVACVHDQGRPDRAGPGANSCRPVPRADLSTTARCRPAGMATRPRAIRRVAAARARPVLRLVVIVGDSRLRLGRYARRPTATRPDRTRPTLITRGTRRAASSCFAVSALGTAAAGGGGVT